MDSPDHMLNELVKSCALQYLANVNPEIRKAAAITSSQLLAKDPVCFQASNNSMQIVSEILNKLLVVGISDLDPNIRFVVLSSLDERFDHHLAQAENVRTLFLALNDEVFSIRELAVVIIGRLTLHNPAYVMPALRKTLIQLLTELEYSTIRSFSLQKEESARLLFHLVSKLQRLIKPYIDPILSVLLPKARDINSGVASKVMELLGQLGTVSGEKMKPYIDTITVLIIETLQDQRSVKKRVAALKSLGQMVSNTGWVVEPYLKYPILLGILINILKSEQNGSIRKETVKVMGILGALDPYKYKGNPDETDSSSNELISMPLGVSPSHEDYYPTVAIVALMQILRDPSLSLHHTVVVQAVMYIFKTLGLKCVQFLPQILNPFFAVMRTCPVQMLEFHFQQLGQLVSIIKQHIRNFLVEIFSLIKEFWNLNANIQITIISLVEAIALALDGDFKVYLPILLPDMLQIFETDVSERRLSSQKVLNALIIFGISLEEYLHLIIPVVCRLFERSDVPLHLKKIAIKSLGLFCKNVDVTDYASRIILPLMRIFGKNCQVSLNGSTVVNSAEGGIVSENLELEMLILDTVCALAYQMNADFIIFIPMIDKILKTYKIEHQSYNLLISKIQKFENLPKELGEVEEINIEVNENVVEGTTKKLVVNQVQLKKAWEASTRSTKEDWHEWIRRFSVELLKESPSHALRACASLSGVYFPLAKELFNAAFVSCWADLGDQYKHDLVQSLEMALNSANIPLEILQTLLNLAEFMEHDDKALPINIRTLGGYANKCHAYAKALHYKEMEFIKEPLPNIIENLISINNQLQQSDSANGILKYGTKHHGILLKESWLEKLERWDEGLARYEAKQLEDPTSMEISKGRLRCLHNLGDWDKLNTLAQERFFQNPDASVADRSAIAPMAAAAAWGLGHWDLMEDYVNAMKQEGPDGSFFKAILALHHSSFAKAKVYIDTTREMLDTELTALVSESYNRAYSVVVRIQMLAELEEIILYKQLQDQHEKRKIIRKAWTDRLNGCQRNVEIWQRILKVRALVIPPKQDKEVWIKFSNLCRKSGRMGLAAKTLTNLLDNYTADFSSPELLRNDAHVVYACLKHLWGTGEESTAFNQMKIFTKLLSDALGIVTMQDLQIKAENAKNIMMPLLARCYLKIGNWQMQLQDDWSETAVPQILNSFLAATQCDKYSYKAYHSWAFSNFEVINYYERKKEPVSQQIILSHILSSLKGFFRSISLSKGNSSLQDTLRLLTIWFKYGYLPEVSSEVGEGIAKVNIDTWLQVIPQLIARIHTPSSFVRRLIHKVLADVGVEHPQALVYSVTVASKSSTVAINKAASSIVENMRTHSPVLVEQASLVSQELIRVAILWQEMWHEGLEEASRHYYGDKNVEGMFATLEPLHQMLERVDIKKIFIKLIFKQGPETVKEITFMQSFGDNLRDALDWCKKYKRSQNQSDLDSAWDLYYLVFRKINKQLPQLTTLELQTVSPKLLEAKNMELAVPGTYESGKEVICISSFSTTLNVITSKQRPRKLIVKGSDGVDYQYLLKGHEDLRQDERVMQLFGLVNTLLKRDAHTLERHLNITQYPVIPLSHISGLIGWVPNTDTLHALIRDYREGRKILINIEHRLMLQMAPDYDKLSLLQKVEVFEFALENTTGQDLYKVLWLKSKNSEIWLDRRTNYTRSLAVMSMVGYILGLGDRHPSNLMLDRLTGKVIHIDFGDCFEVAMHREKFPEKIPFRLTRMLINAMEVSGIEGNFRMTCEHVMRVLREHKDSLMAVLEAF
ncbi:phosphatidylinositol kinase- protein kinase tor1, partial [Clydaea vesicula]